MKYPVLIARLILGLIFVVFGMNGFLQFIPMPPMSPEVTAFMTALMNTGFIFPIVKGIEVLAGVMILSGFWLPLALILLSPILVVITGHHFMIAHDGYPMVIVILVLHCLLAWNYRAAFAPLFKNVGLK